MYLHRATRTLVWSRPNQLQVSLAQVEPGIDRHNTFNLSSTCWSDHLSNFFRLTANQGGLYPVIASHGTDKKGPRNLMPSVVDQWRNDSCPRWACWNFFQMRVFPWRRNCTDKTILKRWYDVHLLEQFSVLVIAHISSTGFRLLSMLTKETGSAWASPCQKKILPEMLMSQCPECVFSYRAYFYLLLSQPTLEQ